MGTPYKNYVSKLCVETPINCPVPFGETFLYSSGDTQSGLFTVPKGVKSLNVLLVASGGSGIDQGGGGGGGQVGYVNYLSVVPGQKIPFTVGIHPGSTKNTSFGDFMVEGGDDASGNSGGLGGSMSVGSFTEVNDGGKGGDGTGSGSGGGGGGAGGMDNQGGDGANGVTSDSDGNNGSNGDGIGSNGGGGSGAVYAASIGKSGKGGNMGVIEGFTGKGGIGGHATSLDGSDGYSGTGGYNSPGGGGGGGAGSTGLINGEVGFIFIAWGENRLFPTIFPLTQA